LGQNSKAIKISVIALNFRRFCKFGSAKTSTVKNSGLMMIDLRNYSEHKKRRRERDNLKKNKGLWIQLHLHMSEL
jgi:hypothetical protein